MSTTVTAVTVYGDFPARSVPVPDVAEFVATHGGEHKVHILGAMRPGYLGREALSLDDVRRMATALAATEALLGLADVIATVGTAPLTVYNVAGTPEVHVHDLQPWLDATGIPAPSSYSDMGHALWKHEHGDRPISPVGCQGFALRHVDLTKATA